MGHEHAVINQPLHILLLPRLPPPLVRPSVHQSIACSTAAAAAAMPCVSAPRTSERAIYREITLCIFAVEVDSNRDSGEVTATRRSVPPSLYIHNVLQCMERLDAILICHQSSDNPH